MTTTEIESQVAQAAASFDRAGFAEWRDKAVQERDVVLHDFPLDRWPTLPLEDYALGLPESSTGFCNLVERRTTHVGSIRGGSSHKLLIFKYRQKPGWYFPDSYQDEREAWEAVRGGFVSLFERVASGDFKGADEVTALSTAPALRVKASFLYYPEGLLPICSHGDLNHFLNLLDLPGIEDHGTVNASHRLYDYLKSLGHFDGWSPYEMERFLYTWAHPRRGPKIVKIAPGEGAKYWNECLEGGYVCVGWDDVGDLAAFGTKEEFRAAFAELNPGVESHISRKANEVWAIRDLNPGDIVVANKGTATVMGIGHVVEPGYEYREDRPEFKHTIAVDWFDTTQRQIEPIKKWAFSTVATIEPSTYRRLLGAAADTKEGIPAQATSDPLHLQLEETLERKRQVVLYGPPGTGKTYLARRFAVSWLWQRAGEDGDEVLRDIDQFRAAENWLTDSGQRRAWWFVASPGYWKWQEMFDRGGVEFSRGKIDANFEKLLIGDLVIGYEASPTKRIVALATVTDFWEGADGGAGGPILEPVSPVVDGPAWQEIKTDELLEASEPVKHQSQGTLFALSEDETLHLMEMIEKADPSAASLGREILELPTGWLTNVTFHPSYTYEDFVEGFKPTSTEGSSGLQLEMTDGIFKKVCTSAAANPSMPHVLIIDEINRGNLPKIFGELITILERDKRGVEVVLPQSGERFSVPQNVLIVGTMNTADRSIRLLDAALRRRFAFIEMLPRPELFEGASVGPLALDQFLAELNIRIRSKYGRDKQVGHSYFLEGGQPITDPETFARVMRDEVMPLLQEYAFDHYGDLREILGPGVVDSDSETLQLDVIADADEFVAALYEEFQGSQVVVE